MAMTPEARTVIGAGIMILAAVAASNRQLRSELWSELRTDLDQIQAEIGRLGERMARPHGLLEGLREAVTAGKVA